jgi:hypothetical protein
VTECASTRINCPLLDKRFSLFRTAKTQCQSTIHSLAARTITRSTRATFLTTAGSTLNLAILMRLIRVLCELSSLERGHRALPLAEISSIKTSNRLSFCQSLKSSRVSKMHLRWRLTNQTSVIRFRHSKSDLMVWSINLPLTTKCIHLSLTSSLTDRASSARQLNFRASRNSLRGAKHRPLSTMKLRAFYTQAKMQPA